MEDKGSAAPLYENLRKVVNLIDELRDIGLQQHISLPRIAVLGTQSAGKSSLLESIVGMDFLPRGDVRSLIIYLLISPRVLLLEDLSNFVLFTFPTVISVNKKQYNLLWIGQHEKPYAVFDKYKDKKFTDFDKVRDMINQLTDEVAGASKGIVDSPITLTVYAHSCPDLTLVDLPGITRIPIAGQQNNIEQVTKEMAAR